MINAETKVRNLTELAGKARRKGLYWKRAIFRPRRISHLGVTLSVIDSALSKQMTDCLYQGIYEVPEAEVLLATLAPEDRVLELGAGIGFLAVLVARRLSRPDQLLIVEANPDLIPLIHRNLKLNGVSARIENLVLGQGNRDEVPFYVSDDFWTSSLVPRVGARTISVKQRDAQALLNEFRPSYLMIDIEGAEKDLIEPLELSGVKKICLEVHPDIIGEESCWKLLNRIEAQGFRRREELGKNNVVFLEAK